MPTHIRQLPDNVKKAAHHLSGLINEVSKEMDGAATPKGVERDRWRFISGALYLAVQHADSAKSLVLSHRNDASELHIRALFEIFVKVAYIYGDSTNGRLLAVLHVDTAHYEKNTKNTLDEGIPVDMSKVSEPDKSLLEEHKKQLNTRLANIQQKKDEYLTQLGNLSPAEFLNGQGTLKSSNKIIELLSIKYMCRNIYNLEGNDLLSDYTFIYGSLSMQAHTSSIYIMSLFKLQEDGNYRVGSISEKDNEENAIRNLYVAYHYLSDIYYRCLKEKGLSDEALSKKRKLFADTLNDYETLMQDS